MDRSKSIRWLLFFLFFSIILAGLFYRPKSDDKISTNHFVVCATIKSISAGKGGYLIEYEFNCKGELIKPNGGCTLDTKKRFDMGGDKILVAIEKDNCYNYKIIETTEDFKSLNISVADTIGIKCR